MASCKLTAAEKELRDKCTDEARRGMKIASDRLDKLVRHAESKIKIKNPSYESTSYYRGLSRAYEDLLNSISGFEKTIERWCK